MSDHYETLELPHGYFARIARDESPDNPFEEWDSCVPIAVWDPDHRGGVENYKGPALNLGVLVDHITPEQWANRDFKRRLVNIMPFSLSDVASLMLDDREDFETAFRELAGEIECSGWRCAIDYFRTMQCVANHLKIPCYYGQSSGYSQGDSALVFTAALPGWVKEVGAGGDLEADCKSHFDLWGAWAWGDVYGIAAIFTPESEELDEGSVWGYYGSDREKSGLLESAIETVNWHRAKLADEAALAHDAACRGIVTV